nr:unnamed protein product [Callosobruchus chinensis]
MKLMFSMLQDNGTKMVNFLRENALHGTSTQEAKKLCSMFTLENINLCVFGMDSQCFQKPESTHMRMASDIVKTGSLGVCKYFLSTIMPKINKLIDVRIVNSSCGNELLHMLHTFMSYREESRIQRDDLLDLMVEIKRKSSSTEQDVLALGANFFIDGYETSSTVMAMLLFELASHRDIQDKLRSEILANKKLRTEKISYEQVQNMRYLDACFNENLRRHSIVSTLGKTCTKTYTYTPTDNGYPSIPVVIEKGTPVVIPISAIHHDPQYFENPNEFYPERFLDKRNIKKYTFMPFGEGPRSCLGKAFGALQIKVGVADIISNFELTVNKKTKLPLMYNPWFFVVAPTDGLWIDFKKIYD